MSLDENENWRHAAQIERWQQQAREDRALDWAEREHELRLRDETESVEAMESHWAGVFAADPYPQVEYAPTNPDRRLHNVSGLNPAGGS